jgi:hypothetical protein
MPQLGAGQFAKPIGRMAAPCELAADYEVHHVNPEKKEQS